MKGSHISEARKGASERSVKGTSDVSVEKAPDTDAHLACTVHSKPFGLIGYLVIHNLVHGRSLGGVRLVPDISFEETRSMARTMAYKYGFIGLPMGGAKAAIRITPEREPQKDEILLAFGKALGDLIKTSAYVPGIDMNCTLTDLQHIFGGAGLRRDWSWRKQASHQYTAWSCFIATKVALDTRGIKPEEATVAIQGFGRVGGVYAELMSQAGARLVALSNRLGALSNESGFSVPDLLRARDQEGDRFIMGYQQGEPIPHDQVLTSPVTVLLPAARAWAIHEKNWQDIQASIIICAANVPMDDNIEHRLFEHGKTVMTDFVANCGGVLGSLLDREVDSGVIWNILNTSYRNKVARLHSLSVHTGRPIGSIAGKDVEDRMALWREHTRPRFGTLRRWMRKTVPERIRARQHTRFYEELWDTGEDR
ncbi:MAG: Glu/Leu/Phe/Val dehydrogenase dimerization domain-containing protein [Acidobacteriota bacterium]